MGDFERDTAVAAAAVPSADGAYDCTVGADWQAGAGPNGGYLAAIVVHALSATTAAKRPLRSLTLHYLRTPRPGAARVAATVEKAGRTVTFAAARLEQDERPAVVALAVLADDREASFALDSAPAPDVPPPEAIEPRPDPPAGAPPFGRHFDYRPAIGGLLFEGREDALTGGWIRLRADHPLDAALVCALCDSWYPAVYATSDGPLPVPTLDLTVHLRAPLPRPPGWVLGRFRTTKAGGGFLEEDAELWSSDGELLAQSRQLALAP